MNPSFMKRICAFIIDIMIVNILVSVIGVFIPVSDNISNLNTELVTANEQYLNKEIDESTYLSVVYNVEYDLEKETIPISIISAVVSLLYFVVLPFYKKGQTLGKRMFNLKIVKSNNGVLEMNDLVIRASINNGIFISLAKLLLIFVIKEPKIMVISGVILSYIQFAVWIVSLIMIIFTNKKQGIHGIISKTEVVEG